MILKSLEIKYDVSTTLSSHWKFAILAGVQKFAKNESSFSQMHLLRNNCATNVAQNFFVNYSLLYLQAYIISWLSYLHGKTYKNSNLRNRLRGGMLVIFKEICYTHKIEDLVLIILNLCTAIFWHEVFYLNLRKMKFKI